MNNAHLRRYGGMVFPEWQRNTQLINFWLNTAFFIPKWVWEMFYLVLQLMDQGFNLLARLICNHCSHRRVNHDAYWCFGLHWHNISLFFTNGHPPLPFGIILVLTRLGHHNINVSRERCMCTLWIYSWIYVDDPPITSLIYAQSYPWNSKLCVMDKVLVYWLDLMVADEDWMLCYQWWCVVFMRLIDHFASSLLPVLDPIVYYGVTRNLLSRFGSDSLLGGNT